MISLYSIAAFLCFILGIVHSILGEIRIFSTYRQHGKIVPTQHSTGIKKRHLRILWATWHLASVLGFGMGIIILLLSKNQHATHLLVLHTIAVTMAISGLLVLYATKGKHPGWIVFLLIALLLYFG